MCGGSCFFKGLVVATESVLGQTVFVWIRSEIRCVYVPPNLTSL